MVQWMDLLRGPALGVIAMVILLAGVLLITAFAALIAQMSLLLRLKPWNTSEKHNERMGSETGKGNTSQEHDGQPASANETRRSSASDRQSSPQVVVVEQNGDEVVDAVWWETAR